MMKHDRNKVHTYIDRHRNHIERYLEKEDRIAYAQAVFLTQE